MYGTTHLALGLIIGKLSGDYTASLCGSLLIDVDHLIPNWPFKKDLSWSEFWRRTRTSGDSSRVYLHSFFAWIFLSFLLYLFNPGFALIFSIAYLGHFILDMLDDSSFYPFYPIKKFNTKGLIPYFSSTEFIFSLVLFFIFLII